MATFEAMKRLAFLCVLMACGGDVDPHEVVECEFGSLCEVPCVGGDTGEIDETCTFEFNGTIATCTYNTPARVWMSTYDGVRGCCVKPMGAEFRTYEWKVCE